MPLSFDLPWEELQTYQGCNPRPDDFDAYWGNALRDLDRIAAREEWTRSWFQASFAECLDLYFDGIGGARVHAKVLQPKDAPAPHPAVLMFHGYGGGSGDWSDKLAYAAAGFTVAALDCRGQGGLSEDVGGAKGTTLNGQLIRGLDDVPEKLLFRQIFLDAVQLSRIVMDLPAVDAARIGVTGVSQGGGLSLACAALVPEIKLVAPVYPFLCDYKRVWQMDQAKDAYFELREYFRRFDPLHEREDAVFTRLGYIDVQHLAASIQGKVMMAVGLMDTVCPPSTQFAAYNKITSEKSLRIYPDFEHEGLPGHSDAIYQFMQGL